MNKLATILLLMCCALVQSSGQSLNTVAQKYKMFKAALPAPRLHLVFNQDKYSAGDTVFFKAYFLKDDLQPVAGRQLINVNLMGSGGKDLQHFLFPVINGIGANQVILPDTLAPGIYLLAAYSSWMKNFETPPMFTKEIVVVGEKVISRSSSPADLPVYVDRSNRVTTMALTSGMSRYQQLYLIITNKDNVIYTRSFTQGTRDRMTLDLPPHVLNPGMNILHIVNKLWMRVATGSHYVPEANPITASIETDGGQLVARKTGTVSITIRDEDRQPLQGEFSIKILNAAISDTTHSSFARDLAMSTPVKESWRQIMVNRMSNPRDSYTTDLSKKGRVFLPDGSPAEIQTRMFFYLQENEVMMQAMTSQAGKIRLLVPDVTGNDELFYMAENSGVEIHGVKIVWDESPINLPAPPESTEINEPDAFGLFAANKKTIDKAFDFNDTKANDLTAKDKRSASGLESRIANADINVDVADYVSFPSMIDLIREIVPALNVRTVRGKKVVQMGLQQGIPASEPLYIIDGLATKDTPYFLSLKPADIAMIRLVTNPGKLATFGLMGRSGIAIVETKSGNSRPPVDASQMIAGLSREIAFRRTTHNNIRRPDFRSTIYWNPIVKTDANGKAVVEFQCSDDLGPIKVRVDGMTSDGRPFSGETTLNFVLAENK